jgi:hypothetical protein
VLVLILLPIALYGFLLVLQTYSAWQATRALDKLQRLHLGDPTVALTAVVSTWKSDRDEYFWLEPISYRADWLGWLYNHISPRAAERVADLAVLLSLRYWRLSVSPRFESGRIASLSTILLVFNREESVGGGWELVPNVPQRYLRATTDSNMPTFVAWFHITSNPGGYGYQVITTPRSSADDLNARKLDSSCLLPFRRCRTPFELLPNVAPLLEKQKLASRP